MENCVVKGKTPAIEKFLVAFFRVAHGWGVKSLPLFGSPQWEDFLELVAAAPALPVPLHFCSRFSLERGQLEVGLKEHDQIRYAFFHATTIDDDTGRMRFDEESDIGLDLHRDFDDIFEAMFIIGWRIDGFYGYD